jgi:hypothetical protein
MCEDYQISATTKKERIIRYISPLYKDQVKAMPEYHANSSSKYDKDKFYATLKKEYKEHD